MRQLLLSLHVIFAALWVGCILTEALFERALLAQDRAAHLVLANLHVKVDNLVEVPAIVIVLLTGAFMALQGVPRSLSYYSMLSAGAAAAVLNFICVWLVYKRRFAAVSANWQRFAQLDRLQHKAGAGVLALVVAAFVAGLWGKSAV
ncbi:MAG: hypothetical protein KIT60_12220 [Burkholderiaceae bacterium]|nr:hypothetical protein [Burkholderiaceae bacterium]